VAADEKYNDGNSGEHMLKIRRTV